MYIDQGLEQHVHQVHQEVGLLNNIQSLLLDLLAYNKMKQSKE